MNRMVYLRKMRMGNLGSTLQDAINRGAGMVELPSGYTGLLTESQMQVYSSALARQAL